MTKGQLLHELRAKLGPQAHVRVRPIGPTRMRVVQVGVAAGGGGFAPMEIGGSSLFYSYESAGHAVRRLKRVVAA
jgi:hypothetical protein